MFNKQCPFLMTERDSVSDSDEPHRIWPADDEAFSCVNHKSRNLTLLSVYRANLDADIV